MRALIFSSLYLISWALAAKPYQLSGEYKFTETTNATFSKRYEPVYAFTQAGRERLTDLRSKGWSCSVKPRQTYLCSKANVASQIPSHVSQRAFGLFNSLKLSFEELDVTPSLLNDSPALTEYRFPKKVTFNGKTYPHFDYLIIHGQGYELHKVKWGEGLEREEFLVENERFLKKVETFSDQEKKYYDLFVIEGSFR
jgi:hypothetical protein